MSDLVARLRSVYEPDHEGHAHRQLCEEAADEIERLTQVLGETKVLLTAESFALASAGRNYAILEDNAKRLRAALEHIAEGHPLPCWDGDIAREALGEKL